MDKIDKLLARLDIKEYVIVKELLVKIKSGKTDLSDCKKLRGFDNLYRIRKGRIRIIFAMEDGRGFAISVGFKDDNTYKGL